MIASVGPFNAEGSLLKGTSDDPSSGPLPITLKERLQILQKWQEQQTLYTEETREYILKSGFSRDKPEKVSSGGPSSTEGSLLKGTSDDPSSGPLPISLKERLQILQKWQEQQTLYTEETREYILKSGYSRDKPEKVSSVGPSSTEGSLLKGTSDDPSSDPLPLALEDRLQILQKWQEQQTLYTEETREFILKSGYSRDKPEKVSSGGPSSTEGSLLKGTSDDPSSGPLPLTLKERLQILQKWQGQQTFYTEETREYILKSGFSRDKPEKVSSVGPSSTEGSLLKGTTDHPSSRLFPLTLEQELEIQDILSILEPKFSRDKPEKECFPLQLDPEDDSDDMEFFKPRRSPDDKASKETELETEGWLCLPASPVGISSIKDEGVLRLERPLFPRMYHFLRPLSVDLGTETSTHIYVVGCMSGALSEKCPVLPSQDKDDGFIRFQSKLFSENSFGSPCLVFKDGQYVVKGMLIGREGGTDTPYELIAITFRCVLKRLGFP